MNKKFVIVLVSVIAVYLLLSLLFYMAEIGADGTKIFDLGDVIWYSIVTLATVGYGDIYPVTLWGKIFGSLFVLGSAFALSSLVSRTVNYLKELNENKKFGYKGTKMENHIVIIGWNNFAKLITDILIEKNEKVAIITENRENIELIRSQYSYEKVFTLHSALSDFPTIGKANLDKAELVFINRDTDTDKLITLINLKKKYDKTKFMVSLDEAGLQETFTAAGVDFVISKNEVSSKLIASYIFEPEAAAFNNDILSKAENENDFDTQQFLVTKSNKFNGRSYGDMFAEIRKAVPKSMPVGISKMAGGKYHLEKLPADSTLIEENDYIIFINNKESSLKIEEIFKVKEGIPHTK